MVIAQQAVRRQCLSPTDEVEIHVSDMSIVWTFYARSEILIMTVSISITKHYNIYMKHLSKLIYSKAHQSIRPLTEGSCPVAERNVNSLPKASLMHYTSEGFQDFLTFLNFSKHCKK